MTDYKMRIIVEAIAENADELKQVKTDLEGIGTGGGSASAGLKQMAGDWAKNILGAGTFIAAGKKVIELLQASVKAYADEELAMVKRNAIFDATDASTRTSITALDEYATTISQTTAVDDDLIVKQEEVMLQFRTIGGELMPQVLQSAIDMAGGFDGDVVGSTETLGRALEMMSQGAGGASMAISTLRRQSIILDTATQNEIISLAQEGKVTEAQTKLLKALADITGGRAAAAADTLAGKQQELKNSSENLGAAIGKVLTPEIERQEKWLNQSAQGWTEFFKYLELSSQAEKDAAANTLELTAAGQQLNLQLAFTGPLLQVVADGHRDVTASIDPEVEHTYQLAAAQQALSIGMSGEVQNAYDTYQTTMDETNAKILELEQQLKNLRANGYGPSSKAVQDINAQLEEERKKQADANAEMQKAIRLMIFHAAAAHLDAKGQLALALSLGLISKADYDVAVAIENLTAKYDAMDGKMDGVIENTDGYIKELNKLTGQLLGIPPEINSTVTVTYVTIGTPPGGGTSTGGGTDSSGNYSQGQGGFCFLAGTMVSMADGTRKAIEKIEAGEMVLTHDFHRQDVPARVVETFHHAAHENSSYLVINQVLRVTPNHPLYTQNGWTEARHVHIGDLLETNYEPALVTSIAVVIGEQARVETFNLHVDHEDHNYYADGFLVHNKFSKGGDFIVPPGYPNDSFPVQVESGERVIVVPRNRVSQFMSPMDASPDAAPRGGGITVGTLIVQGGGIGVDEMVQRINLSAARRR
jgi:hypothetical protein